MMDSFKHSYKVGSREPLPLLVVNVGFQQCGPLYCWGPGVRDHFLVHYIVSGKGVFRMDQTLYAVRAGQVFIGYPGREIFYQADESEPWEYYWVGFSGAALLLEQTALTPEAPVVDAPQGEQLRQVMLQIYGARGRGYVDAVKMGGYLQAALGILMEQSPRADQPMGVLYARRCADFLESNYSRAITVEDAAAHIGISRSHLYRVFLEHAHLSPSEYLQEYRIRQAASLLRRGNLPVAAIARSVGFDDPLYFSRVFRRRRGMTPTDYRASRQE